MAKRDDTNRLRLRLRAGRIRLAIDARFTPDALKAAGGVASGVLLSAAALLVAARRATVQALLPPGR